MFKKCFAGMLAVMLLLLCFACGQTAEGGTTAATKAEATEVETNPIEGDGKIAVIVGNAEQEPELYPTAKQLSDAYGDTLMILGYSPSYYAVATGLTDSAVAAARDPSVKALVFAGGVNGTANAAEAARRERDDLYIIVCNPLEGTDAFKETADLVLSVDFAALANKMVQDAKSFGAENFLFYTTDRSLKLSAIRALRTAVNDACKSAGLTSKALSCVDIYAAGKTLDMAKRYLAEDALRKAESIGKKTALFCTEPFVQGALAEAAAAQGMFMPASFLPSPIALADGLGLTLTGHEADSAYALAQLQAAAKDNGTAGHVMTWSFSTPIVFLQAAVDQACAVLDGGAEATADSVQTLVQSHTDASLTVTADGNVFLVDSTPVTLGK